MFTPGQEVVCVEDRYFVKRSSENYIKKGNIYVVSAYLEGVYHRTPPSVRPPIWCPNAVLLQGIVKSDGLPMAFYASRFQPVQRQHKGMEVLKRIALNPNILIEETV